MAVNVGDKLPQATFTTMGPEGPKRVTTDEVFAGKTVALFAVPGAFTPTCSMRHLPGFKDKAADLKAKGVDAIACVSVNDVFVMNAWGKDQDVGDSIIMLADGNGEFTKAVGLELDASGFGMGGRIGLARIYSDQILAAAPGRLAAITAGAGDLERAEPIFA